MIRLRMMGLVFWLPFFFLWLLYIFLGYTFFSGPYGYLGQPELFWAQLFKA